MQSKKPWTKRRTLIEVAVTKMGRSHFAVAYIRPDDPASARSLDDIRQQVAQACGNVHAPSRMEIVYTGHYPYVDIPRM